MTPEEKYGINTSYEHKTACPRCLRKGGDKSGNNLHVYGPGLGAYCWACEFTILSDEQRASRGLDEEEEEEEVSTKEPITKEENSQVKSYTGTNGKGYRGIREEISKAFGVRFRYDEETGDPDAMYTPTQMGGKHVGYKVRGFPKDFQNPGPIGVTGKDCDMVGQFMFKTHRRTVVIVGGETKQLNAYQMLLDSQVKRGKDEYEPTAVVCPTIGESGCHKQVQKNYEFFAQFDKIVVCMDNDAAGKEATTKICQVLPKGKAWVMTMRYKDADDYVVDKEGNRVNLEKHFIDDFWGAKPYTPDGIVASTGLSAKVRENAKLKKIPLPPFMHKLQKMMAGGIPLKTIINLASASGTGKSTIIDECTYDWIFNSPYRPGIVTLESDSGQYATKLLSRHVGRKIDLIEDDEEKMAFLDREDIKAAEHNLWTKEDGTARFYLVEERDGGLDSLKALIENLIIACECQLIILDPLQDILDGHSLEVQQSFLKWMKGMLKSHDVSFINVNHVRKSGGGMKANSTGAELHEEDLMGSSSIFKSGACNLLFMRNKEAEDPVEKNTTKMKASKIRWTGKTGVAGEYYYDNETHRMYDLEDWLSRNGRKDF